MIKLLITDLDNTIYNWVDYFIPCFNAMVSELARLTGLDPLTLRQSFKRVHQRHGTTEYAFAIEELDVLPEAGSPVSVSQLLDRYSPAIRAFRSMRRTTLRLYDAVPDTLATLRSRGIKIVAHTDAMMFYAVARSKQLDVEHLFDGLVAPRDHGLPTGTRPEEVRFYREAEKYEAKIPFKLELEPNLVKPNPECLNEILWAFQATADEAVYVGDSPHKDIRMAQSCGVHAVLAEYGRQYQPDHYRQLVEISHWTDEDVMRELDLRRVNVSPSFKIARFHELLSIIDEIDNR